MINIVLCGGSGTRLWPLSRTLMPKQFVKLFDKKSLFQLTVERNSKLCDKSFIVSNAEQYFLASDQKKEFSLNKKNDTYLLEPIGKNTAPAVTLACMALHPEDVVLVTPSDHLIKDEKAYFDVISQAEKLVSQNNLVTFGIEPLSPETGFGYIEANNFDVKSFKEKPDKNTAQNYLNEGNYYWNSGMFMFKAGVFLDELQKYSPEIYKMSKQALENTTTKDLIRISYDDMNAIPEDSIDYAVMEKSKKVKVVPSNIAWSDLGSFESLAKENLSLANVININSSDNLVLSDKQVATIDINNLIIIDTPDSLLVSKKGSSQKVKQVVSILKEQKSELTEVHTLVYRPWGSYEVILSTENYKIKRIIVQPGKRLSLQKHYYRKEHWVVVSGTAKVTVGEEVKILNPNESTYIGIEVVHRLENNGNIPLILIEIQLGTYTGEDDIVRLEDDFNRR